MTGFREPRKITGRRPVRTARVAPWARPHSSSRTRRSAPSAPRQRDFDRGSSFPRRNPRRSPNRVVGRSAAELGFACHWKKHAVCQHAPVGAPVRSTRRIRRLAAQKGTRAAPRLVHLATGNPIELRKSPQVLGTRTQGPGTRPLCLGLRPPSVPLSSEVSECRMSSL